MSYDPSISRTKKNQSWIFSFCSYSIVVEKGGKPIEMKSGVLPYMSCASMSCMSMYVKEKGKKCRHIYESIISILI